MLYECFFIIVINSSVKIKCLPYFLAYRYKLLRITELQTLYSEVNGCLERAVGGGWLNIVGKEVVFQKPTGKKTMTVSMSIFTAVISSSLRWGILLPLDVVFFLCACTQSKHVFHMNVLIMNELSFILFLNSIKHSLP